MRAEGIMPDNHLGAVESDHHSRFMHDGDENWEGAGFRVFGMDDDLPPFDDEDDDEDDVDDDEYDLDDEDEDFEEDDEDDSYDDEDF